MSFEATTADAAEGRQFRAAPTLARRMHARDVSPVRRAGTRRQRADHDVDPPDADRSGSDSYGEDEDVYVVFTQQPVPLVDPVYSRFLNYLRAGELHHFKALGAHARLPGTSTYAATFDCFRHAERPETAMHLGTRCGIIGFDGRPEDFRAGIQGFMSDAAAARRAWKEAGSDRAARIEAFLRVEQAAARTTYRFHALLSWVAVHKIFNVMRFLNGPLGPGLFGPTMLRWLKNLTAERVPASFKHLGLGGGSDSDEG
jgi:hypothetical protein